MKNWCDILLIFPTEMIREYRFFCDPKNYEDKIKNKSRLTHISQIIFPQTLRDIKRTLLKNDQFKFLIFFSQTIFLLILTKYSKIWLWHYKHSFTLFLRGYLKQLIQLFLQLLSSTENNFSTKCFQEYFG